MNAPARVSPASSPLSSFHARGDLLTRTLVLFLWLGSTAALAASREPPFEKGTVLEETPDGGGFAVDSTKRIGCAGRLCLWHHIQSLGPCFYGLCTNEFMLVSDLKGRFLGATHDLESWATSSSRFIDGEHVEFVVQDRNEPFSIHANGLDPTQVSRQVMKVAADGSRFIPVPSQAPKWTKPAGRRGTSKPPKSQPVGDELLAQARALCPKDTHFIPVDYTCQDETCLLLFSGAKPSSDADGDSTPSDEGTPGPFCGFLVKGTDLQELGFADSGNEVRVTPWAYVVSGPVGARGSMEPMETLSRYQPGYMVFSDTEGAVVDGIRPYPVRSAQTLEAALALAPTAQAYTLAHLSWGAAGWKNADDLAFAWRLARVGDALVLHAEVQDDKVVPLGKGTGVHSDHLELTVPLVRASGPSSQLKVGVLLAAGGQVEAQDWTGDEIKRLRSIQGTWRKRPRGYEMTLTLPLVDLGVEKPNSSLGLQLAVSDADARGKQETMMGHEGVLMFWTEYPPSIAEYRLHGGMD
ncbi:hypothetical protein [Myxococcus stipitatus]|uniref:hypothetical protein n=1 Tax=Myxococcus stipitatus TaxID=83455 RepID=UPI0030CCF5E8